MNVLMAGMMALLLFSCRESAVPDAAYSPAYTIDPAPRRTIFLGIPNLSSHDEFGLLVTYLNKHLRSCSVRINPYADYRDFEKKIKGMEYDLLVLNGPLVPVAESCGYSIRAKMGDDQNYRSYIVTRVDSSINKPADLKGKIVATLGPEALAGTMLPLYFLQQQGLNTRSDIRQLVHNSYEASFLDLYQGKCSAAFFEKQEALVLLEQFPQMKERLALRWETPPLINKAVLFSRQLDPKTANELLTLFLGMGEDEEGKDILHAFRISRFEKADSLTYRPLCDFLKKYYAMTP